MTEACESSAAYVLGALSAGERSAFEAHLATCMDCRRAVADLAGIPGLLSRVSRDDLADPLPVPDTLVPGLLRSVRRSGRRRRVAVGGLAAAAVVLAVAGTLVAVDRTDQGPPSQVMTAMEPVVDSPVSASVSLVAHGWGTAVTMTCRYADAASWSRPYDLVAVDDRGTSYHLATWVVGPGKTAAVSGSVPVQPDHIDRLEIRLAGGEPLLRLRP